MKESKRTVWTFSLASFFNDAGSEIINPIWPLFVTGVLGLPLSVLGLIDGIGDALVSFSQAAGGYYSDKFGKRKPFIWGGYLLGMLSRAGFAFAMTANQLIPLKALNKFSKIRGAPRDAMVADSVTKHTRGAAFGTLRAFDNLGAVVGVLIATYLITRFEYRTIFLIAALPTLVSVLLVLFFIHERPFSKHPEGYDFRKMPRNLQKFLAVSSLFALATFSYSFLLVYSQTVVSIALVPILYLIYNLSATLLSYPMGRLADSIGRKRTLVLAYGLFALMSLGFLMSPNLGALAVLFILYGAHKAALEPSQKAFVSELAPKEYRASVLGAFQMAVGLMALPSSLIAGFLWDSYGPQATFSFALVLSVAAVILLNFVKEKQF